MMVIDIVREYLIANGYDGLCRVNDYEGCGCKLYDLFVCEYPQEDCIAAYANECKACSHLDYCDISEDDDYDYLMRPVKCQVV